MAIVSKNIRQGRFANLALELSPVDTSIVSGRLPILFGLQPALHTVVMNELNTTSAFANLEQWINLIKLTIPTKSTLRQVVVLILYNCRLSFVIIIL